MTSTSANTGSQHNYFNDDIMMVSSYYKAHACFIHSLYNRLDIILPDTNESCTNDAVRQAAGDVMGVCETVWHYFFFLTSNELLWIQTDVKQSNLGRLRVPLRQTVGFVLLEKWREFRKYENGNTWPMNVQHFLNSRLFFRSSNRRSTSVSW